MTPRQLAGCRTPARWRVNAGDAIAKVSAWLGHTDTRRTMMYAHLAPGHDADIEKA